jgi:hypothetical protein
MSIDYRKMAGDKAKAAGQHLHKRNLWSKQDCIDYVERDIMPMFPRQAIASSNTADTNIAWLFPEMVKDSLPAMNPDVKSNNAPLPVTDIQAEPVKAALLVTSDHAVGVKEPLPDGMINLPVKNPLPVVTPSKKQKNVLANGRNKKGVPKFENWFCQIFPGDFLYPAWRALTKTATDVVILCRAKSAHAAARKQKNLAGVPIFDFTFSEAVNFFKLTRPTFSKAMQLLLTVGFIKYSRHGGIMGGIGIKAQYTLSDEWKTWQPPKRNIANITKARLAKKCPAKTKSQ